MRAPGQSRHRTTPGGMNRSLRFAGNLLRVGAGLGTTLAVVALLVSSTRPAPTSVSPQLPVVSRASNGVDRVASSPSDKPLQVAVAVRDPEIDEAVVDRIRRPLQQQIGDLQCQLEHLVVQQRQQGRERQNREQELFQRLAPQETLRKFDRLAKQIASLKEILDERLVVSPVPQPAEAGEVKPVLVVSRSRDQQGRFSIVAREAALIDVLEKLGEFGHWEITATIEASTPVSVARLQNVTIEEALEVLLRAAGCAARLDGNRLHVMTLAQARIERQKTHVDTRDVSIDVMILAATLTPASPLGLRHIIEESGQVPMRARTSGARELPIVTESSAQPIDWGVLNESPTAFLQRLQIAADVRVVATPRIRVTEGKEASFDMGQPLEMPEAGRRQGRTNCLEIGTRIVVRPKVLPDGRVQLDIGPEQFSALIGGNRHWLHQASAPVSTRVLIPSGRTMVLSGLIQELPTSLSGFADDWIEELLGFLGKSPDVESEQPSRRELIMLVTPRIVDDARLPQVPRQAAR